MRRDLLVRRRSLLSPACSCRRSLGERVGGGKISRRKLLASRERSGSSEGGSLSGGRLCRWRYRVRTLTRFAVVVFKPYATHTDKTHRICPDDTALGTSSTTASSGFSYAPK